MSLCRYQRRHSYTIPVGEARLGGESPLLLQSMANVSTMETNLCVAHKAAVQVYVGFMVEYV